MLTFIPLQVHWTWDLIMLLGWGAFVFIGGLTLFFYNDYLKEKKYKDYCSQVDDVVNYFVDALSEETPEESGPYSGSEWSSSAPDSFPTEKEGLSADQTSATT